MDVDLFVLKPKGVSYALWSELFISTTLNSELIRDQLAKFLRRDSADSPEPTIAFILQLLARNPELAEQFKDQVVLLVSESSGRISREALNVIVASQWYDQVPRFLDAMDDQLLFFSVSHALIDLLSAPHFAEGQPAHFCSDFENKLLAVMAKVEDLEDQSHYWNLLLRAFEKRTVPITAVFAVVGFASFTADLHIAAINRVLWSEYSDQVERAASALLAQLRGMLRDSDLKWNPDVADRVAELLVRILDSDAEPQARLSALRILLVLAKDFRRIRGRLEEYSTSRYLGMKGRRPRPWWQRWFS